MRNMLVSRLWVAAMLLSPTLTACPGSLDNADEFRDATPTDTSDEDTVADTTGGGDTADTTEPACTPENIRETLFVPSCGNNIACHGDFNAGELNLTEPDVSSRVFGVTSTCDDMPLAVAGDPDASFMWEKVTVDDPTCGAKMPVSVTPLTQEELDCIEAWITTTQ